MSYITADESVADFFGGVLEPVEIRNSQGELLGHFTPALSDEEKKKYADIRKLIDPEEIKRRKERSKNDPGRSLAQIMERLHTLERGE